MCASALIRRVKRRNAPPRIAVTGIEPDITIVPGETVSFEYHAEDDLAVSDIIMDWSVAGGIHQGNLGGEEYLLNKQLGQKVVDGQKLMKRVVVPDKLVNLVMG